MPRRKPQALVVGGGISFRLDARKELSAAGTQVTLRRGFTAGQDVLARFRFDVVVLGRASQHAERVASKRLVTAARHQGCLVLTEAALGSLDVAVSSSTG